jgi:site-specific DNA-methyltransferase (adenine-specific)
MSVYYQDELVTLYHGDCHEITDWLSAKVLITDPPYGRNWQSGSGMTNSEGRGLGSKPHGGIANDQDTTARDSALDMWEDGLGAVFGDLLIAQPRGAVQACIYEKPLDAGVKGARGGMRRNVEAIYLIGPWPAGVGGESSVFRTGALVAGPRGLATRYGHPHAKPVDVLERLISKARDVHRTASASPCVIADPFAGAGSTLVAASALGLPSIGVELDERYCEITARRLDQGVLTFGEVPA